jgi:hypothetical protein
MISMQTKRAKPYALQATPVYAGVSAFAGLSGVVELGTLS